MGSGVVGRYGSFEGSVTSIPNGFELVVSGKNDERTPVFSFAIMYKIHTNYITIPIPECIRRQNATYQAIPPKEIDTSQNIHKCIHVSVIDSITIS